MATGLLAALAANWDDDGQGGRDGTVTLKILTAQLKEWMEGKSTLDLLPRIKQLRLSVADAARATHEDLRQSLAPDLEQPLRGSLEVFEDLDPILAALEKAYARGNRSIQGVVDCLEESRADLLAHEQAMQEWLRAPVLRCPRCGRRPQQQERACAQCQVEMLYPDPESALDDSQMSAHLGPDFLAVFKVLSEVVRGDASLSRLPAALSQLESTVSGWADMAEDEETSNSTLAYALDTLAEAARRVLDGSAQMRSAVTSRQTRDLTEGWKTIFNAAQEIQGTIPILTQAAGAPKGDHFSTQARFTDAVIIEGD